MVFEFPMLNFLTSFINDNISLDGKLVKARKTNKATGIYRDELDTKKQPSQSKPKKRVRFETTEEMVLKKNSDRKNTIFGADDDQKSSSALKVKILMTKEEAARLLSKCQDGGVLEFKDVARELVQIPINRVSVVSSSSSSSSSIGSSLHCLLENSDKEH